MTLYRRDCLSALLVLTLLACSTAQTPTQPTAVGGQSGASTGGSASTSVSTTGAVAGASNVGGATASVTGGQNAVGSVNTGGAAQPAGGATTTGGKAPGTGGAPAAGGVTGGLDGPTGGANNSSGGANTSAGGGSSTGGKSSTAQTGGAASTSPSAGGQSTATGGATGTSTGGSTGTDWYATNPPQQCANQDYVQGCIKGDTTTPCQGQCVGSANACQESASTKGTPYTAFACSRWMLYSDAMNQAAIDDGNSGFNYAVVGHDADTGGIDGTASSSCCQCYQLVYDYPAENQAWVDPGNSSNPQSAINPVPPPLIVQSFNTATNGPDDFDVFMAAGGFGGNNACDPNASQHDVSGLYFYTQFPANGANDGGVKAANKYTECKTTTQWVTTASLSSSTCQAKVAADCNQITARTTQLTTEARNSCIQSNAPDSFYHMNWYVYVKKVECPEHLTEVTGCRLTSQGLPAVNTSVTTAAQAALDSSFKTKAANGNHFSTTTMQDCCKPSCASQSWISGKGLTPDGKYDSFYSCDQNGVPLTESSP